MVMERWAMVMGNGDGDGDGEESWRWQWALASVEGLMHVGGFEKSQCGGVCCSCSCR